MKRVVIYRNGKNEDGKLLPLSDLSFEQLLSLAGGKFGIIARRLFTAKGGEVDDVSLIRDDEILYLSEGEPFISPTASNTSKSSSAGGQDWVTLNVGGKYFSTTRCTILTKEPNSMLARMFADSHGNRLCPSKTDSNGAFLIDRCPTYFQPLLNYLRHAQMILDENVNPLGVLEEAKFFGIDSAIPILELIIQEDEKSTDDAPITRRDVINALLPTSHTSELRFQGVNLARADLSRLDLRRINFKYANLQHAKLMGANLAGCCIERADLSYANLEGANLLGVKLLCANLEGANLKTCNFEDPAGSRANMEGVNLKGANLEGSQMAGVNLRVATLKNANLQNCDLRGAVLAGADLENCDLSGSDLHEANLRGANLKDAAFEWMMTPLHMSQTVR
ncbi:hypothetical protein CHUAL_008094 [Chamberlinius hualienensis]